MITITLEPYQNAYDIVSKYVKQYMPYYGGVAIVSIGVSRDGINYDRSNETVDIYYDSDKDEHEYEWLYDWYEGEKYIRLYGIVNVCELEITGGID